VSAWGNLTEAGRSWAAQLQAWAIPDEILAQAPESPWHHDPASFAVDGSVDRDSIANRVAREVLPPTGGTVLDVGCGGGRSSVGLVPPAVQIVGVDEHQAMLEQFAAAVEATGAQHLEIRGRWPVVVTEPDPAQPVVPVVDVVVSHHVLYNVPDIERFLVALTEQARLAVVVELTTRHPQSAMNEAWRHVWGLERPSGPTDADLVDVLRALGIEPEVWHSPKPALARHLDDPDALVRSTRRRLCLPADRDDELRAWLADHPPAWPDTVATVRWPGDAPDGAGA
jgi:SAM-dependent methyltransferase